MRLGGTFGNGPFGPFCGGNARGSPQRSASTPRALLERVLHVGVVSLVDRDRGRLTSLVWYRYEEGVDIVFTTRRSGAMLRKNSREQLKGNPSGRGEPWAASRPSADSPHGASVSRTAWSFLPLRPAAAPHP